MTFEDIFWDRKNHENAEAEYWRTLYLELHSHVAEIVAEYEQRIREITAEVCDRS